MNLTVHQTINRCYLCLWWASVPRACVPASVASSVAASFGQKCCVRIPSYAVSAHNWPRIRGLLHSCVRISSYAVSATIIRDGGKLNEGGRARIQGTAREL